MFLADLSRGLGIPHEIDFIRARSYGKGMHSSGAVEITKDIETDLTDRHIILVEDIADTGLTMSVVAERLMAGEPASVHRCALLLREGSEPVPEYLSHRDAILADPNLERALTGYYNSKLVRRKLRDGTMRAGRSKMRSISDLRFSGVNKDYLKIQGKYTWQFDG